MVIIKKIRKESDVILDAPIVFTTADSENWDRYCKQVQGQHQRGQTEQLQP